MSELEFFLLKRILTQNSNFVEFENFLNKNQRLQIQIKAVALKVTSCRTMSKKQNWKKVKIQDSMGKNKLPF
jgi:hypothetical protein